MYKIPRKNGNGYMSVYDVLKLWRRDISFCYYFSDLLRNITPPDGGFFLECYPFKNNIQYQKKTIFKFNLIPTTELDVHSKSDPSAFEKHFHKQKQKNPTSTITHFQNLSHTAILVVPLPFSFKDNNNNSKYYSHISSFIHAHPSSNTQEHQQRMTYLHQQQGDIWRVVAEQIQKSMRNGFFKKNEDIYVSTSGLAVPWLHVRIEKEPKYYKSKFLTI